MDSRFLELYEGELKHVRKMGGEFARAFPKIAGRLGLDEFDCADPYVERMIEAFAFLTARVHMRFDSSFAEFTAHLLELLYPGYLAPTPSMAVVQLRPNSREGALKQGVTVSRGASLRSRLGANQTACEYRTAHAVTLWPIEVVSADYTSSPREFIDVEHVELPDTKAALRIVLQAKDGANFSQLPLESLPVFLRGEPALASRLREHMLRTSVGMVLQLDKHQLHPPVVSEPCVKALGFADDQALLPCAPGGFHGHRLLHEYFAFPERFSFVELHRMQPALERIDGARVEIILLLREREPRLEGVVNEGHLALFCTPAINLFARTADRIHLDERDHEHHIVVDRTRPRDFEVHSVTDVKGHGPSGTTREFLPMYTTDPRAIAQRRGAHFTVRRQSASSQLPDRPSARAVYAPSEVFISLVDGLDGPGAAELRQLSVETMCTNRSLPLQMPIGLGNSDFSEQSGAPVESVRCVAGPTPPRTSLAQGDAAWALLSHLALDYTTIVPHDRACDAGALRQLLSLYSGVSDAAMQRQIQGVLAVSSRSVVRPLPFPGPTSFGRGIEVRLSCDESAFEGSGAFLLAAVLERFFAKYASINTFTETVLESPQRGEVMRWPATPGHRAAL